MSTRTMIASSGRSAQTGFIVAGGFWLLFDFGQYAIRSAPGAMVPELTPAFGLKTLGVSSLLGLYYCSYSAFAIVVTVIAAVVSGLGATPGAEGGRLLQGSGTAMIPYSIIKEVNPDKVKGSATGAINFLVFTLSAVLAPGYGWLLNELAGGGKLTEAVFQNAGSVGIAGIILAIVLAFFLRETGASVVKLSP